MATIDTANPTTTVREHTPGIPDDGETLSGEIDLATITGWTFLSSFVAAGLSLTYNSGGPSVDIGAGRIARTTEGGQELVTVGAVSGLGLASGATNYVYYRADDTYEVIDVDEPPSAKSLLIGTVDTGSGIVDEDVRGRSPVSQFAPVDAGVSDQGATEDTPATLEAQDMADTETRYFREHLTDSDKLKLLMAGVISDALSSTTGLSANVITEGDGTTHHTTEAKREVGDPLVEISGPADVRFELENATGGTETGVSGRWNYKLIDQVPPEITGEAVYVIDDDTDSMYQFSCSTAWDVSTASSDGSFDVSGQESVPRGMVWNDDGTSVYTIGSGSGAIQEFACATAYDVTTASHVSSFNVSEDSFPFELDWNSDGSILYVVGYDTTSIYQYNCSTAFDATSASADGSFGVGSEDGSPQGMAWNSDGTSFYLCGDNTDSIYQYAASTAFDVTTGSLTSSYDVSANATQPTDVSWKSDGTSLYVVCSETYALHQWNCSTAFDITTATYDDNFSLTQNKPWGMAWDDQPQYP